VFDENSFTFIFWNNLVKSKIWRIAKYLKITQVQLFALR